MSTALAEREQPTFKRSVGKPPRFDSPEAFQRAIDDYFDACDTDKRPYTMAGLANAVGLSRQGLLNYESTDRTGGRDRQYVDAVKRARSAVEQWVEEQSLSRDRQVAGHIFNLKNNFGWRDTQEIEHTHTLVMLGTGEQPLAPPVLPDITVEALSPQVSLCKPELTPTVNTVQSRITVVMDNKEQGQE